MYLGLEHAVYTPNDCLCVGGFFLNEVNVPGTMDVVRTLQTHDYLTNNEAPPQTFRVFETYYETLVGQIGQAATPHNIENFAGSLRDFINTPLPKKTSASKERKRWAED